MNVVIEIMRGKSTLKDRKSGRDYKKCINVNGYQNQRIGNLWKV
ncbi:MAG: hypothetical protein AB9861_16010 [Methanosarcina sp.]|jgi:hypothetical protein